MGEQRRFTRYIGIDYSGAKTPVLPLPQVRVYEAEGELEPQERFVTENARRHWSRKHLATWLSDTLAHGPRTIVGIDHAFSFPQAYFSRHGIAHDWQRFLEDFQKHWPSDGDGQMVNQLRNAGGRARSGDPTWMRRTENFTSGAKSVFRFGIPGQVATSSHAGLPWLLRLRKSLEERVHFWPFDGWVPGAGQSLIAEVYPALWNKRYHFDHGTTDQRDAYAVARWLSDADASGLLDLCLRARFLSDEDREVGRFEGWILGVL